MRGDSSQLIGRLAQIALLFAISVSTGCASAESSYRPLDHWDRKSAYDYDSHTARASESRPSPLAKSITPEEGHKSEYSTVSSHVPPAEGRFVSTPSHAALMLNRFECSDELDRRQIKYRKLNELKGVAHPVEILGYLGGVEFYATDGRPFQMDCRLAISLDQLKDVFRELGVTRIRYSGAYTYRRTRSGRLSHHALGLAIDVHEVEFHKGQALSVESDFAKGIGCGSNLPRLNRLACSMRNQALFEEFLTPDFNWDHRDHLHISVPRSQYEKLP